MTLISATDDLFAAALDRMRPPHKMHIICIDITNKCDLACSNCTRLLENQDAFWDMSLENFREAVRSLSDFPGTIAVIGGNPAMHRDFEGICKILVEEIPQKERRGLWTNNVFKHAELVKEVFGGFNLNPHGDARGIKSLEPIRELKIGNYYEGHSMHSPLLTAVKDIFPEIKKISYVDKCIYILYEYYIRVISIGRDYKYNKLDTFTAAFIVDKLIYDINAFVEISIEEFGKSYWDVFKSETQLYNAIRNLLQISQTITFQKYGYNEYVYNIAIFMNKYYK